MIDLIILYGVIASLSNVDMPIKYITVSRIDFKKIYNDHQQNDKTIFICFLITTQIKNSLLFKGHR